jgi:hypothetical protein
VHIGGRHLPVPVGGGNGTGKKSMMSSARHQVAKFAFEDVQLAASLFATLSATPPTKTDNLATKEAKPWCKAQAKEYLTFE